MFLSYTIGNFIFSINVKVKVRILSRGTLRDFWEKHNQAEEPLKSWFHEVDKASWKTINELKVMYPNASVLQENRICFNIKGNSYRLIVKFNFEMQMCFIRFIGTHAEYDKVDANNV